jgi:hypothetical protein
MRNPIREVTDLVGARLNAVAFVMDYIELHFDGPIVRSLARLTLTREGRVQRVPEVGARDGLCECIGAIVRQITLRDAISLQIELSNGATIEISLDNASRIGPEAMHFVPEIGGPIQVW